MKKKVYLFKVYKDKKNEWRWTLFAPNGRKIADSAEGYKAKASAMKVVNKLIDPITYFDVEE